MRAAPLFLALLLGSCIGHREPPPLLPRGSRPVTLNLPTPKSTQQCFADLSAAGVRFSPLPDRDYGGGCQLIGTVQLIDVGVPVSGIGAMRCELARGFIGWVRNALAPAAHQMLGSDVVRVDTFGSYSCRNVIGNEASAARLSGHAIANAVDVSGVRLADGRRITVGVDWASDDPAVRDFWKTVHASACKRFGTVLSPDYNAAHHDHLHLEADRAGFCR